MNAPADVMVLMRRPNGTVYFVEEESSFWVGPNGKVGPGEAPLAAAVREVNAIGLTDVFESRLFWLHSRVVGLRHEPLAYFYGLDLLGSEVPPGDAWKAMTRAELTGRRFPSGTMEAYQRLTKPGQSL